MRRRSFAVVVGGAALAVGAELAGLPGRAAAAAGGFRYGVHHPHGAAAVDYAYGPDGMWRPTLDVSYRWNYYQQYATPAHPYDRAALIAYADGTHWTTARDANGHLLLDFNHDGEIDVSGGGSAFVEHFGRGAGNVAIRNPFTNFWFDDNWLARYMSTAYGRPLPNGLSAYADFNRWQILAGDSTAWTPYGTDFFDTLALDGLYHLSRGEVSTAYGKWARIRDTSGARYDGPTRRYRYPSVAENYHLGLFKILTDQLLGDGRLGAAQSSELIQHSVAVRSAILENQQADGAARGGWTSGVVAGTTLMNTESLAVNTLALGAAAPTTYEAGQPPLRAGAGGYVLRPEGTFSATAGTAQPGHLTYGPYETYPAGGYTVEFVLRSASSTGSVARVDVYDAQADRILAGRDVPSTAGQWVRAALPVTITNAANRMEFRTWWYGQTDLDVAQIRVTRP